jgi:hypothetical protein
LMKLTFIQFLVLSELNPGLIVDLVGGKKPTIFDSSFYILI